MRRLIVAVLFLPLFGCVSGLRMQSLPASHLASPQAEEAPLLRGSTKLRLWWAPVDGRVIYLESEKTLAAAPVTNSRDSFAALRSTSLTPHQPHEEEHNA